MYFDKKIYIKGGGGPNLLFYFYLQFKFILRLKHRQGLRKQIRLFFLITCSITHWKKDLWQRSNTVAKDWEPVATDLLERFSDRSTCRRASIARATVGKIVAIVPTIATVFRMSEAASILFNCNDSQPLPYSLCNGYKPLLYNLLKQLCKLLRRLFTYILTVSSRYCFISLATVFYRLR